jgi:hypothetical protein
MKTYLIPHLHLERPANKPFVIKRNNKYSCLANNKLRFLDMLSYLPAGTSYDKFLVTFKIQQRKRKFCLEFFDSIEKFDYPNLPPKEAYYSELKQCNVLENDTFTKFTQLTQTEQKTTDEALKLLQLDEAPTSSIDDNYEQLLRVWDEQHMNTCRDYLEWYNNLDVGPFVTGVLEYKHYFVDLEVDLFKDCISIPGLARQMMFKEVFKNNASFALIDPVDGDLYQHLKDNIIGGVSCVFTRHHRVGETFRRDDAAKPCQAIAGYDSNYIYVG